MGPGAIGINVMFGLVFAVAGALRKRGLRRAARDARRLAEMRAQLETLTRLNAMGEMGAVLAHELNQPLTAIATYASAASRKVQRGAASPEELAEVLEKVTAQARRAGEIIARVRGYVTRGDASPRQEALSVMFGEAAAVAMAGRGRTDVVLRSDFDPQADQVLADRIQVQQVMLNLMRNAIEAMGQARRRELRIGAQADGEGFVQAYVADTGPGVSDDMAERMFQPFVTTKGNGLGVGLSISRSIIEQHGGKIWAERNADGGATFRFTLRRAGTPAHA
jgi:two-component system sensor kinase FixL